jgi:hypothetical protein
VAKVTVPGRVYFCAVLHLFVIVRGETFSLQSILYVL